MRVLLVHQNFPGQFRHLAPALARRPGADVICLGDASTATKRVPSPLRLLTYTKPKPGGRETHHYIRSFEGMIRRGQAVARTALALKRRGWTPDLIYCHPGWGEAMYLKEVWPDSKLLCFFEFFYNPDGRDVGFDAEFPAELDDRLRVRTKNAALLFALDAADHGISPTEWQRSTHPDIYHDRISVVHDGIDTGGLAPNREAQVTLPDGRVLTRQDRVLTYVARNLEPYRGFHQFMRAVPEIQRRSPDAQIVVVGADGVSYGHKPKDGTYRERYLKEIEDSYDPDRLHFLGKLPYEQYLDVLRIGRAHIYLTYPFVLSWSMLEAMSCGALLIGSDTAPVREVIRDGENGYLVGFFDREALVERAVEALQSDPDRFADMRDAARQTVIDTYDLKTICLPRQLEIIDRVAGLGGQPEG